MNITMQPDSVGLEEAALRAASDHFIAALNAYKRVLPAESQLDVLVWERSTRLGHRPEFAVRVRLVGVTTLIGQG